MKNVRKKRRLTSAELERRTRVIKRRQAVETAMLRGIHDQRALAAQFGVTAACICNDMQAVQRRWQERAASRASSVLHQREAELYYAVQTAYNSFFKSQIVSETTTKLGGITFKKSVENNPGDPKFLGLALQGLRELSKIQGLEKANTFIVQQTNNNSITSAADVDDLLAQLAIRLDEIATEREAAKLVASPPPLPLIGDVIDGTATEAARAETTTESGEELHDRRLNAGDEIQGTEDGWDDI